MEVELVNSTIDKCQKRSSFTLNAFLSFCVFWNWYTEQNQIFMLIALIAGLNIVLLSAFQTLQKVLPLLKENDKDG